MMRATATERFEAIGSLYFRTTGRLRPGQDEPPGTGRDSGDAENRERFDNWLATAAFSAAFDEIVYLRRRIEELETDQENPLTTLDELERARHAEEVESWKAVAQELGNHLVARTADRDSLRDQLRKVEGEREEVRAHVAEVQNEHDEWLRRAGRAEEKVRRLEGER